MGDRAEELKAKLEAGKQDESSGKPDWSKRIVWWSIRTTDRRGKLYEGRFRSKIPDMDTTGQISALTAALANHTPFDSLSADARMRFDMLASFQYWLVDRPDWFASPGSFLDRTVPDAVYDKLREHFEGYFQPGPHSAGSPEEDAVANGALPPVAG